jgi:hypothetical protein
MWLKSSARCRYPFRVYYPKLPVLEISSLRNVPNMLTVYHSHMSQHTAVSAMCYAVMHTHTRRFAYHTAVAATSRGPQLLISYLDTNLCRLEHWLRDWRIAVTVSRSTEVLLLLKSATRTETPSPVFRNVSAVGRISTDLGSPFIQGSRRRHTPTTKGAGQRKVGRACPSEVVCCCATISVLRCAAHARSGGPLLAAISGTCKCCSPSVLAFELTHIGTVV